MKNIILIIIFLLFIIKHSFAIERIEDTNIFDYYQTKELKIIAAKTKKSADPQTYLNQLLIYFYKIKDNHQKFILLSSAIEYASHHQVSIGADYINEFQRILSIEFKKDPALSCMSYFYLYSRVDNESSFHKENVESFINQCEFMGSEYYLLTLGRFLNQIIFLEKNKNINELNERLYNLMYTNPEYQVYADYSLGSYYLLQFNKTKVLYHLNKIKNSKQYDPINDYYYQTLYIYYLNLFDYGNYSEFNSQFYKLTQIVQNLGLNVDQIYLEMAWLSITYEFLEKEEKRKGNRENKIIFKKKIDEYFKRLKNSKLSQNQTNFLKQTIILVSKQSLDKYEDLLSYVENKFKTNYDTELFLIKTLEEVSVIEKLYDEKKYSEIISKYSYLENKKLNIIELSLVNRLFDSYLKNDDFEKAYKVLLNFHEAIFNSISKDDNIAANEDLKRFLNTHIINIYVFWAKKPKDLKLTPGLSPQDLFFITTQLINFNEVSSSINSINYSFLSKDGKIEKELIKNLSMIEQQLIISMRDDETNSDLINNLMSKYENQKSNLNRQLNQVNASNAISAYEFNPKYLDNDELMVHFVDTNNYVYAIFLFKSEGFTYNYLTFSKKDEIYNLSNIDLTNNINKKNFVDDYQENNFLKFFKRLASDNLIKKVNIIHSPSTSNIVFESLLLDGKYMRDYFSFNYLPSLNHYMHLKDSNWFRLGIQINKVNDGLEIIDSKDTSYPDTFQAGDVIVGINQKQNPGYEDIGLIKYTKPGQSNTFQINRNGMIFQKTITNQKYNSKDIDFIGFANPIYNKSLDFSSNLKKGILRSSENTSESIKKLYSSLSPLEETEDEIKFGSEFFNKSKIFIKEDASIKNFFSLNNKSTKILSIATHAIEKNSEIFLEPALVLSFDEKEKNYGLLTTSDITSINLDAELVILSACSTASSGLDSNLMYSGLARAFMTIGVENLIISRWPVDSYFTTEFMKMFYSNLDGSNYSEAFHKAQKEIKKSYPDPYYWASFIFLGV